MQENLIDGTAVEPDPPANPVIQSFAIFRDNSYALIPHKSKTARWIFMHSWLLSLIMLFLAIFFSLSAVYGVDNKQVVWELMSFYGPRANTSDCRWLWIDDPRWYGRVICDVELTDPAQQWARYAANNQLDVTALPPRQSESEEEDSDVQEKLPQLYRVQIVFDEPQWTSFFMSFLTVVLALPALTAFMIISILMAALARKVPESLYALAFAGRLQQGQGAPPLEREIAENEGQSRINRWFERLRFLPRSWWTYASDLERAINHPLRFPVYLIVWVFFIAIAWNGISEINAFDTEVIWSSIYAWVLIIYGTVSFAYIFTFLLWYLLVIAVYLGRITPLFKLDIQPEHGDQCGGLQRLGQISLIIAMMIIVPVLVFVGLYWFGLLPLIQFFFIGSVILLLLLLIIAAVAFFAPLWRVHTVMRQAKARYQDDAVANIAPIEQKLRRLIVQGRLDEAEAQKLDRELERLRALYPATHKYPTWPFSSGQLLTFLSGQLVAVFSIIVEVANVGDMLADLLH